jgi:hypothetical protein
MIAKFSIAHLAPPSIPFTTAGESQNSPQYGKTMLNSVAHRTQVAGLVQASIADWHKNIT